MRVLLVTAEYPPAPCGGIGVFYGGLAAELAAQGAGISVLAADPTVNRASEQSEGGVRVLRVPVSADSGRVRFAGRRFDAGPLQRARALTADARAFAAEISPDVVETHDWAAPLWRPPLRPFVVRLHGSSTVLADGCGKRPARLLRFLERRMLAQADAVVAVSEWVRRSSSELFGMPGAAMELIPNGVDAALFGAGPGRRAEEVVYAGALRQDKGVCELLEALAIVLRQRPAASATLAGGPDAWFELPSPIRAQIERLQTAAPGRIRLTGRIPQRELAGLYQRAGACVFPSHVEAFGLACAEAMSCGAPVVASKRGAGAELVEDGRSGLLADPREPREIADAILSLLADPAKAGKLGRAARRRVLERYSMRQTARRTLELYDRIRRESPWRQRPAA